ALEWLCTKTVRSHFSTTPGPYRVRRPGGPHRSDLPLRSVHGQNHAKARLPSHHLRVGIRRLVEWDGLDHGRHAAQRTEAERSVSGRRVPRQGTFELAAPEYEIQT